MIFWVLRHSVCESTQADGVPLDDGLVTSRALHLAQVVRLLWSHRDRLELKECVAQSVGGKGRTDTPHDYQEETEEDAQTLV